MRYRHTLCSRSRRVTTSTRADDAIVEPLSCSNLNSDSAERAGNDVAAAVGGVIEGL